MRSTARSSSWARATACTQEWLHHSLLSRSVSLLSRAQGIRARLPLTYSYPTPSREESAVVAVQAQPPVLAVSL